MKWHVMLQTPNMFMIEIMGYKLAGWEFLGFLWTWYTWTIFHVVWSTGSFIVTCNKVSEIHLIQYKQLPMLSRWNNLARDADDFEMQAFSPKIRMLSDPTTALLTSTLNCFLIYVDYITLSEVLLWWRVPQKLTHPSTHPAIDDWKCFKLIFSIHWIVSNTLGIGKFVEFLPSVRYWIVHCFGSTVEPLSQM